MTTLILNLLCIIQVCIVFVLCTIIIFLLPSNLHSHFLLEFNFKKYDKVLFHKDVALIELPNGFSFNSQIRPLCLHRSLRMYTHLNQIIPRYLYIEY